MGGRRIYGEYLTGDTDIGSTPRWFACRDLDEESNWLDLYRVVPQGDQLVVAEIRIVPRPENVDEIQWVRENLRERRPLRGTTATPAVPEGGLSARVARAAIHTGEALDQARRTLAHELELIEVADIPGLSSAFTPEMLEAPRRPGRKGRRDRFYAEIAAVYMGAIDAGSSRPVHDVAERLGRERNQHYSVDSVRALIHQARQRGLLTRSPRGQAGGQLTEKAAALLTRKDSE